LIASETPWRPTKAQLEAARNKSLRDIIARGLDVLFCGINPGLYSAAVDHHFARPGNRFWPALAAGGFTPRIFSPFEERLLLDLRCGITNIARRATATADELLADELRDSAKVLIRKVRRYQPKMLAVLGVSAYRIAFDEPAAVIGLQERMIGATRVWILPNPSGLNAHYQPAALAKEFQKLRREIGRA